MSKDDRSTDVDLIVLKTATSTEHEWAGLHGKTIPDEVIYTDTINPGILGVLQPQNYIRVPGFTLSLRIVGVEIILEYPIIVRIKVCIV